MDNSILITGANGFIGNAVCSYLINKKIKVTGLVRNNKCNNIQGLNIEILQTINNKTNWEPYLKKIDIIIHTAGYSKFPLYNDNDKLNLFNVNVLGTINLAKQAAQYGVKKIIYISSIKVHGENTKSGSSFNNNSIFNPQDTYALSKVQAEEGLEQIRKNTNLDIIIIRPPLVYGNGIKSNLLKLINIINIGVPLPFKSISKNKISLISLENLNSFIYKCIEYKSILNMNFVVSDSRALSTKDLIEKIASTLNKKARLFYFPKFLLFIIGYFLYQQKAMRLLLCNLEIDNSFSEKKLNWKPKAKFSKELRKAIHE